MPDGILDEYDCLIAPISERLSRGAGSDELHAFLATELPEHFGLDGRARREGNGSSLEFYGSTSSETSSASKEGADGPAWKRRMG